MFLLVERRNLKHLVGAYFADHVAREFIKKNGLGIEADVVNSYA